MRYKKWFLVLASSCLFLLAGCGLSSVPLLQNGGAYEDAVSVYVDSFLRYNYEKADQASFMVRAKQGGSLAGNAEHLPDGYRQEREENDMLHCVQHLQGFLGILTDAQRQDIAQKMMDVQKQASYHVTKVEEDGDTATVTCQFDVIDGDAMRAAVWESIYADVEAREKKLAEQKEKQKQEAEAKRPVLEKQIAEDKKAVRTATGPLHADLNTRIEKNLKELEALKRAAAPGDPQRYTNLLKERGKLTGINWGELTSKNSGVRLMTDEELAKLIQASYEKALAQPKYKSISLHLKLKREKGKKFDVYHVEETMDSSQFVELAETFWNSFRVEIT